MNTKLMKTISYIFLTSFIAFFVFLLKRLFPWFSQHLDNLSGTINTALNLDWNIQLLGLLIAFCIFIPIYFVLSQVKQSIKTDINFENDGIEPFEKSESKTFSVIKFIFGIIFIPFIISYGLVFIKLFTKLSFSNSSFFVFVLGFIVFSIIWIIFHKRFSFLSIFEHEFTHMVLGLIFLHRPKQFYVEENSGGWVQLAGGNFIITLGPYFLLTLCFFIMPLYLIIMPTVYIYYFFILGFLTSYHTFSTIKETRFNSQPDIIYTGKIFSLIVIILGNILNYGILLSFVVGGFPGINNFLKSGWDILFGQLISFIT